MGPKKGVAGVGAMADTGVRGVGLPCPGWPKVDARGGARRPAAGRGRLPAAHAGRRPGLLPLHPAARAAAGIWPQRCAHPRGAPPARAACAAQKVSGDTFCSQRIRCLPAPAPHAPPSSSCRPAACAATIPVRTCTPARQHTERSSHCSALPGTRKRGCASALRGAASSWPRTRGACATGPGEWPVASPRCAQRVTSPMVGRAGWELQRQPTPGGPLRVARPGQGAPAERGSAMPAARGVCPVARGGLRSVKEGRGWRGLVAKAGREGLLHAPG